MKSLCSLLQNPDHWYKYIAYVGEETLQKAAGFLVDDLEWSVEVQLAAEELNGESEVSRYT